MKYLILLLLLAACQKYEVCVRQMPIDRNYLASTHVGTPDPRQAHPPFGQKLIIDWTVPPELLSQEPRIVLSLVYKNYTEKQLTYPITSRSGYTVYSLLNEEFFKTKGLLTYRAEIVLCNGEIYREWKHQLWANLITLSDEKTSSSDAAQSTQGSVTETPKESAEGLSDKN